MDLIFHKTLCPSERRRCRHCNGCIYFDIADHYGCCDYYMKTGKRRPGKFAQPDCPVKKYPPKHKANPKVQEFISRVDAEEALKDRILNQPTQKKKPGRKPTWDTEYGLILYAKGYYYFEIAEVLDTTQERVSNYASDNFWVDKYPKRPAPHRHDLEAARAEYEQWKKHKNEQKGK